MACSPGHDLPEQRGTIGVLRLIPDSAQKTRRVAQVRFVNLGLGVGWLDVGVGRVPYACRLSVSFGFVLECGGLPPLSRFQRILPIRHPQVAHL